MLHSAERASELVLTSLHSVYVWKWITWRRVRRVSVAAHCPATGPTVQSRTSTADATLPYRPLQAARTVLKRSHSHKHDLYEEINQTKLNTVVIIFLDHPRFQGCGVGVSHLKETLTPGPICLIWTFAWFCCSLFDLCTIHFTTKTLYTIVHLLLEEFKNLSQVILKYTIITSHNKS